MFITFILTLFLSKHLLIIECVSTDSDFARTVKDENFVDKTLLLQDFANAEESTILLTAPPGFGKSTAIDMFQRFFSINVNHKGKSIRQHISLNYKIFCSPPLKICKDKTFVERNFGMFPVIHVNYEPLLEVRDLHNALKVLTGIVRKCFAAHHYLTYNATLWKDSFERTGKFIRYFNLEHFEILNVNEILISFVTLSRLLYKQFSKNVIILVDNYDTFLNNLITNPVNESDEILNVLSSLEGQLLKYNPYLHKGLVVGVHRVSRLGMMPNLKNFSDFTFQIDSKVSKYFGLSSEEVDFVISKKSQFKSLKHVKNIIDEFYGGYSVGGRQMYNPWSVMRYFRQSYTPWAYISRGQMSSLFGTTMCIPNVSRVIQLLINGDSYSMNQTSWLTADEILAINDLVRNKNVNNKNLNLFVSILYNLGYLTDKDKHTQTQGLVEVKVPNVEAASSLLREILECGLKGKHSENDLSMLRKSLDSFVPFTVTKEKFEFFRSSLYNFFNNSDRFPTTVEEVKRTLFVNCFEKYFLRKNFLSPLKDNNEATYLEKGNLIFINDYRVSVEIKVSFCQNGEITKTEMDACARDAHDVLYKENKNVFIEDSFDVAGRVYIGFAFHTNKRITIACSSHTKSRGDYLNATLL